MFRASRHRLQAALLRRVSVGRSGKVSRPARRSTRSCGRGWRGGTATRGRSRRSPWAGSAHGRGSPRTCFPSSRTRHSPEALERSLVYDDEALDAARVRRDRGLARELAAGAGSLTREPVEPHEPELLSASTVGAYLQARKVLPHGDSIRVEELGGGVSNVVLAVSWKTAASSSSRRFRGSASRTSGLPSGSARSTRRARCSWRTRSRLDASRLSSTSTRDLCTLTMTAAPSGWATWKERLLTADADAAVARSARGDPRRLARRHVPERASSRESFGDQEVFDQLRVDPYYRTVARRRPELAEAVGAYVRRMGATRACIVHGDYSPKNVLVGDGLWVIDFEVAHFGDPGFDVAFMLNHLLLKRLHLGGRAARSRSCARGFWEGYSGARAARADARSPVRARACRLPDGRPRRRQVPGRVPDPGGKGRRRARSARGSCSRRRPRSRPPLDLTAGRSA